MGIIKILGAGPSGLTSAIVLSQQGRSVRVYEKEPAVGMRFNGDFQGIENWTSDLDAILELSNIGIGDNFFCKPFYKATVFGSNYKRVDITAQKPLFYLVIRGNKPGSLEWSLEKQCKDLGVEIRYKETIPAEEADIIAVGPQGKPTGTALGYSFNIDYPDGIYTTLNQDLSPGAYTYFIIADNNATLATVLVPGIAKSQIYLERSVIAYEKLLGIKIRPDTKSWGGRGNFRLLRSAVSGNSLFCGEAAGFQDNLFGFGIRYAMLSGALAARSILEGADYDRLWKDRLLQTLRTSRKNRKIFDLFPNFASRIVCAALKRDPHSTLRRLYNW